MTWLCRFGEDDDDWIEFQCAGQFPAYVAQVFVESHVDCVGEDEEFFIVQVKRPNKDAKITTVRVEVDFIPTFKGIEVRQEAPE